MNRGIKKLWVAALLSGNYKQVDGALRHNSSKGTEFCCLGVLCDIYQKSAEIPLSEIEGEDGNVLYGESMDFLPKPVVAWAELEGTDPAVKEFREEELDNIAGGDGIVYTTLSKINDAGFDFTAIAAIIDKEL